MKEGEKLKRILFLLCCIAFMFLYVESVCAEETKHEYDENGRIMKTIYEDGSYEVYSYDEKGNVVEVEYYSVEESNPDEKNGTSDSQSQGKKAEEINDNNFPEEKGSEEVTDRQEMNSGETEEADSEGIDNSYNTEKENSKSEGSEESGSSEPVKEVAGKENVRENENNALLDTVNQKKTGGSYMNNPTGDEQKPEIIWIVLFGTCFMICGLSVLKIKSGMKK